jgi:mono/diheme cytochrome c family protein
MKLSVFKTRNIKKIGFYILIGGLLLTIGTSHAKAQSYVKWVVPETATHLSNPIAGNQTVLPEGKKIYMSNCSPCHGNTGKGDGPAAAALNPKPADHTSTVLLKETDGSLYWKISEGRKPMPSYKKALTDAQRWELVNYIRSISKAKR